MRPGAVPVLNGMDRLFERRFQDANTAALFDFLIPVASEKELEAIHLEKDRALYSNPERPIYTTFNLLAVTGIRAPER